jgi:hypothetical protein
MNQSEEEQPPGADNARHRVDRKSRLLAGIVADGFSEDQCNDGCPRDRDQKLSRDRHGSWAALSPPTPAHDTNVPDVHGHYRRIPELITAGPDLWWLSGDLQADGDVNRSSVSWPVMVDSPGSAG